MTTRKILKVILLGMLITLSASCSSGGGNNSEGSTSTLVFIAVTPANPSLASDTTQQFTAIGTYSDSTTKDITSSITWSSSNTDIATISNIGLATSIAVGSTTITATSGSLSVSTTLTVTAATLSSISVMPVNSSTPVGIGVQFAATGTYSDGTSHDITVSVTWSSSNTSVAVVSKGLAKTISVGTTTITATSGSISGSTTLTVISSVRYSHLLIIYPNTNVVYIKDGTTQSFIGSMSDGLKTTVINAFKNLPNLIKDGSLDFVSSTCDIIEISRPITQITQLSGNNYCLSDQDIQTELNLYAPKGKYDSVHVVWNNGPIDAYFGLGGSFVNSGTTTFSSFIVAQEYFWTGLGENFGEPFLHEWLHGVCRFYASLGYPMPAYDADGATQHGYTKSPTDGWMGYYRDIMRGQVWEPALSRYTGITNEAWGSGTPNSQ